MEGEDEVEVLEEFRPRPARRQPPLPPLRPTLTPRTRPAPPRVAAEGEDEVVVLKVVPPASARGLTARPPQPQLQQQTRPAAPPPRQPIRPAPPPPVESTDDAEMEAERRRILEDWNRWLARWASRNGERGPETGRADVP